MNTTVHRVSNYKCAMSQANFVGNCTEISAPFPVALCRRPPRVRIPLSQPSSSVTSQSIRVATRHEATAIHNSHLSQQVFVSHLSQQVFVVRFIEKRSAQVRACPVARRSDRPRGRVPSPRNARKNRRMSSMSNSGSSHAAKMSVARHLGPSIAEFLQKSLRDNKAD